MNGLQELHSHLPDWIVIVVGAVVFIVNLLFALGVLRDANRMEDQGREPLFVGPNVWFFGVLFGSFLVLALYWLMHYSSLRGGAPKPGEGQ